MSDYTSLYFRQRTPPPSPDISPYGRYAAHVLTFDESLIPDESIETAEDKYDAWAEQYKCQTCPENIQARDTRTRKLWVWRSICGYMKDDFRGKRSCPECVENRRKIEEFKAGSPYVPKTDAKEQYDLTETDMKKLKIHGNFPNPFYANGAEGKLYSREECSKASASKRKAKMEREAKRDQLAKEKEQRKADKASARRERASASASNSTRKKGESSRASPYDTPKRRGRPPKTQAKVEFDSSSDFEDEKHLDTLETADSPTPKYRGRSSKQTIRVEIKVEPEDAERMDMRDSSGLDDNRDIKQEPVKSEPGLGRRSGRLRRQ